MRILEVSYKDPECHCGGVEDFVLNMTIQLTAAGHDVICLHSQEDYSNTSGATYEKVNIMRLKKPNGPILSLLYKILFNIGVVLYVFKNRKKIDAIHINGDNGVFLALFFRARTIATFFGLPILRVRNTFQNKPSAKNYPRLMLSAIFTLLHFCSLFFSKIVVADNPQIKEVLMNFRKTDSLKLVYNSVNTDVFKPVTAEEKAALRREMGLQSDAVYAIWVGNDARGYGQDVAFSIASNHLNDMTLLSIGAYGDAKSENIIQLGRVNHETLARYFGASDFMIFPQRYPGISLSMVSAMISGLKVVTYSKYLRDFFTDDNVFFADNENEMDKKVVEILRNREIGILVNQKRDPILSEFYPEYCAQRYLEFFVSLYDSKVK